MFNTTKRVLALVLALALVFSLAGCSKPTDDGSSVEYIVQEEVVYEQGESTGNDGTQSGTQSGTPSGTQTGTPSGTQTGKYVVNKVTQAELDALKGKKVKFASTIDPKFDGTQNVVDSFEQKYGMKVEIVGCSLGGYIAEMQGLINADQAPDVGRSNGDFPGCLAYFQSLDAAKLDYDEDIWNQTTFNISKFNGAPYMCDTYGCYWTELDIVMYSKKMLDEAGCKTPEEYAADGNWTWDSFMTIAKECSDYYGKPMGYATWECALHMAGGNVYSIKDEKIVSGINNKTTEIMTSWATGVKDGYINTNKGDKGLVTGDTAITTCHAWNLRNDSDLANAGLQKADAGFWYLPSYKKGEATPATGIFRGFGVMRGAKNPVGAGIFLRHYLDVDSYKSNLNTAFISEDAKTFFFQLTGQDWGDNYNPFFTYIGLNTPISGVNYNQDIYSAMYADPSVVPSKMAQVAAAAQRGADELNKHIQKYVYSN